MTFEYESKIYLGEVVLYVADLARQKDFYQRVLGLELLKEQDGQVALGRDGQALVKLLATSDRQSVKSAYGLYHLALLLPSRQALADILKHLSENKVPMVGGADHGYSEAIYLEDPEGNGIELYRDKPQADWDIREDGRIIGVTEALAAQEIYELGQEVQPFSIAAGTRSPVCSGLGRAGLLGASGLIKISKVRFPLRTLKRISCLSGRWCSSSISKPSLST